MGSASSCSPGRLQVASTTGLDNPEEYICADMSGQFIRLQPTWIHNDDSLHLTITDGNGDNLLDDTKEFGKKTPIDLPTPPGSAKAATNIGVLIKSNNSR